MDRIAQGILTSLTYFDLFDFPLTRTELWRWWWSDGGRPAPETFETTLRALRSAGRIAESGGFVMLPKRETLARIRTGRQADNRRKLRRAIFATRVIQWLPFVRLVALCNTAAIGNARPESDIDLFIVAGRNRLWLVRFGVTLVVSLLGLRRSGKHIANRLCLSFFVSETALDFRPLLLRGGDPYFTFWIDQLVLLLDTGGVLGLLREKNSWVQTLLPNAFSAVPPPIVDNPFARRVRGWKERVLSGRFGDWLEYTAKKLQKEKMLRAPNAASSGAAVVNDDILKFHEQDRRLEYRERFRERLREVLT